MERLQYAKGDQRPTTTSRVLAPLYLFGLLLLICCEVSLADMRNATNIVSSYSLPAFYFEKDSECIIHPNNTYNDLSNSIPCVSFGDVLGPMLSNYHPATPALDEMIPSPFSRVPVPSPTRLFKPDTIKTNRHYDHPYLSPASPQAIYSMYHFIKNGNIRPFFNVGRTILSQNYRAAVLGATVIINHEYTTSFAICVAACFGGSFVYNYLEDMFPFAQNIAPDRVDIFGFVQNNVAVVPWGQLPWVGLAGIHEFNFQVNNAFQNVLPQENINIILEFLLLDGEDIDDPDDF